MAGVNAPTIARLLGHTTLAVTDAYMYLSEGHLQSAMERLEQRVADPQRRDARTDVASTHLAH